MALVLIDRDECESMQSTQEMIERWVLELTGKEELADRTESDWKAVCKPMITGKIELYDLSEDLGEAKDVAAEHPDVVAKMKAIMTEAHVPSPRWQVPSRKTPRPATPTK